MLAALVLAPPLVTGQNVTTVYVTSTPPANTPAGGEVARSLDDATRELREAVARKKGLRVVDDPGTADVRVDVTNAEQHDAGDGGFGGIKLTPLGEMVIHFHVTFTTHETGSHAGGAPRTAEVDLKGIGQGYWSRAAKDGVVRLSKWIADQ